MHKSTFDDGYVEDSEGEGDMVPDLPAMRNALGGLPPPPQLPPPVRAMDVTVSTIQTPNFTSLPSGLNHPPQPPTNLDHHNKTVSTIQSANFTTDRVRVSDISSFPPIGADHSSIQTAHTASTSADSSISTSTSALAPVVPRGKPRPRPVFKKKDLGAAALAADTSISSGFPSSSALCSANVSFPSLHAMLPPLPPMQVSSTPSHTATTVLTTQRVSDSGVDILDVEMMDIAERAKLRSRTRTQAKGKQPITYDDVIELSSSDGELSSLPQSKSKSKPKPKPRAKKPAASKDPVSEKSKLKGKSRDPSKPSPSKRPKTTHVPDGFESDVDTIPVATSDFPIPVQQPPLPLPPHMRHLSSQLPPSDPPPSTSGSSAPRSSQDAQLDTHNPDRFRDESPLSSPPPPMPRKRKRLPPSPARIRGLDDEDHSYMGADEDSVLVGRGPAHGGMVPVVEITSAPKKSRSKGSDPPPPPPSPGIVPETQPVDPPAKDTSGRQKKKRGSAKEDGEAWDAGLDEELLAQAAKSKGKKRSRADEEDEEEYGASSSKPKAKAKKEKEKAAKKAPAKEKAPPKEKAVKGNTRAKGKAGPKTASKDVVEGLDGEVELSISTDKDQDAMPPPPIPVSTSKRKEKDQPSSSKGAADNPEASVDASVPRRGKGKQRAVVLSDEEDDGAHAVDISTNAANTSLDTNSPPPAPSKKGGRKSSGGEQDSKENEAPIPPPPPPSPSPPASNSNAAASTPVRPPAVTTPQPTRASFAHSNRAYTISSKKTKSTPMSELIRRVSSLPSSPFPATSRPMYSPLAKASKSALRRIAPLHPNRRTPPPPPPRPPPPKKSKKMLEMEERWEMELEDSVEGWYAMPEEERAALRRAKRDHELGFDD